VKWEGVMRKFLVASWIGEILTWIRRKVQCLFRDRGGWVDGMGPRTGEARLCLICNHLHSYTCVKSVLLYGYQTWLVTSCIQRKL
jgi:hypothetical protein